MAFHLKIILNYISFSHFPKQVHSVEQDRKTKQINSFCNITTFDDDVFTTSLSCSI